MPYDIKELTLGEVLDQAVALVKARLSTFLTIAFFLYLPLLLVLNVGIVLLTPTFSNPPTQAEVQAVTDNAMTIVSFNFIIVLIFIFLVNPVTTAAIIWTVANEYLGVRVEAKEGIQVGMKRLMALIGTNLLAGIVITIGLILLIIPGIYFMFKYLLTTQTVVFEGRSGQDAMQRSGELMKGNMGNAFVLGLVLGIIHFVVGMITGFIPVPMISAVVGSVIDTVLFVFGTAAFVVFYFSCRCKAENFDLKLLAQNVGQSASPAPAEPAAGA